MADFFQKKGIARAATFDERRSTATDTFTKLSKRAQTFVGKTSTIFQASVESVKVGYSDVLYRRYFGLTGDDFKIIPPLNQNRDVDAATIASLASQKRQTIDDKDAVVITDVFSTGAMLAYYLYSSGYKIVCCLSGDLKDLLDMKPEGLNFSFVDTISFNTSVENEVALAEMVAQIKSLDLNILAVFAGAETGVELADQLSETMGLTTNGTALSEARRNKYVMGETIRAAGIRAVKQLHASSWKEIEEWIKDWNPNPFQVIVKPMDSAGSDDVTLCKSITEVQTAFGNIMGKVNGLGIVNKAVLVQEYLDGDEYVVDIVSRDGEHKVVAIWLYDRRPVNGAGFVCFGQKLLTVDDPHCKEIIEYQKKVITALGIRHGPTHGEVKWCHGEPVLVEVGARCHGGDGMWVSVANECFGFDQVHATIAAYLEPEKFAQIPSEPKERHAYAWMKWLINYQAGIYEKPNPMALKEITSMDSYRGHQIFLASGKHVIPTQNCFSWGGCVKLTNKDENKLNSHYERIEFLEKSSLFVVKKSEAEEKTVEAVAVVDPFSTGAVLAADLYKLGYAVIAVYSAKLEALANLQNLVPAGFTLNFEAVVPFDDNIFVMINSICGCKKNVIAVFAGAETGVELADQLSETMGLTTNGTALSEARRNKYVMGETIRAAGIRAVKQLRASDWKEVEEYMTTWNPNPFQVIVKPMDSAGSDDVVLCTSLTEVKRIFDKIMGKVNGLGLVNKAVLVQEYLDGQEYVIDMVSHDGEHKVIAIWAYDRKPCNGAGFVCFGQRLLTADEPNCKELIEYQKKVITALGIRHGPTHGEVKWCRGEPVLVEVGARCHGVEGNWQIVEDYVYGYNQVQCTIDSYLFPQKFAQYPERPLVRNAHGGLLFFIVFNEGIFKEVNPAMLEEIEHMKSFIFLEIFLKKGVFVKKTIDCYTFGGVMRMVHEDEKQLIQDYNRIREMEQSGLFVFA